MKKTFFSVLSRRVGTLLLSLAIALGVAYYQLGYVPQHTARLNHRYFRVLARLGQNIKEKIAAQHFSDEGDALSLTHLMAYRPEAFFAALRASQTPGRNDARGNQPGGRNTALFVQEANRLLKTRPGPEKYAIRPLPRSRETGAGLETVVDSKWLRLREKQCVFGSRLPSMGGQDLQYELTHAVPIDTLLRELLRPDVFDYFCVIELPSQRMLYSNGPTDLYLAGAQAAPGKFSRMTRWLTDSSLVHAGRAGTLSFGGEDYRVFAQPAQLGPHLTCLLVGGVPSSRFEAESRALPAGYPEVLLGLLLLSVLALPFLKLRLMSPQEQINRRDVLRCTASLVLGPGILLLTLQAALAKYDTENRVITKQLADLSADIAEDLRVELTQLNDIARQVDDSLRRAPGQPLLHPNPTGRLLTWRRPLPCRAYFHRGPEAGRYGDYLTWISPDGQAKFGLDPTPAAINQPAPAWQSDALAKALEGSYCLPSLAGRRYLKKMNTESYQQVGADAYRPGLLPVVLYKYDTLYRRKPPYPVSTTYASGKDTTFFYVGYTVRGFATDTCYFDMVRTVPSASLLRAPSYRQDVPRLQALLARPGMREPEPLLCAFETKLRCFEDQLIPPGYGFCLIERNGDVMAHSNPNLKLSENLLTDCEPSRELQAALYAQQPTSLEVVYQGKPTMLYVRPLPGMDRYLITFFDLRYAKVQQTQTSLLALTLLSVFWLLGAAFGLLRWQLLPHIPHYYFSRDRFQYLWPRPAYAARYGLAAAGVGAGLLGYSQVAQQVGPLSQLFLLLLTPLPLYVLTYHYTRSQSAAGRQVERYVQGLVGLGLATVLAGHWYWVGGRETAWLAAFALGLVVLVVGLTRNGLAGWLGRWLAPARSYQVAYALLLLRWLGLLGVVPALSCYRVAYLVGRLQQVRYGQLRLLTNYRERHQDDNYRGSAYYYHCKFFFGSQLEIDVDTAGEEFGKPVAFARTTPVDATNLRFFATLPLAATGPGEASAEVLVEDTVRGRWHPWRVTALAAEPGSPPARLQATPGRGVALAGDSLELVSQDNASRSRVRSRLEAMHLGWPTTWPGARRWLAGVVVVLVMVLWALIRYLLRRLFGLSGVVASPTRVAEPGPAGPARRFWLLPAGSAWADVPAWARNELGTVVVVDCCHLDGLSTAAGTGAATIAAAGLPAPVVGLPAPAVGTVVVANLDYRPTDANLTRRKAALLRELQQRDWPLVVLSASHPDTFGDCGHPLEQACPVIGHQAIREAGELLLDALAEFRAEYFALPGGRPLPVPPDAEERLWETGSSLAHFFDRECQALPFVAGLRQEVVALLWQQHKLAADLPARTPTRAAIKAAVQQLAQFNFRRLWLALTPQEKFVLFDLAQDGLANTDNRRTLNVLLQKGFLRLTSSSRLSLSSTSFQEFVLAGPRRHEALRYVAHADAEGTWAAYQLPVMLLLTAGALFLFSTQRSMYTQAQNILLGLTSLIPTLIGLTRTLLPAKPAPPTPAN